MKEWKLSIRWVMVALPLLAAAAMPAMAGAAAGEGYRVVISDLNLHSPGGVDALYGRLRVAAFAVCGFDQARGYAERHRARRCVSATLDAVVAGIARGTDVSRRLGAQHRAARNRLTEPVAAEQMVGSLD